MPRGKKKQAVVFYSPEGGHIIGHGYHCNKANVKKDEAFRKMYDSKNRKYVVPKVKTEKHS